MKDQTMKAQIRLLLAIPLLFTVCLSSAQTSSAQTSPQAMTLTELELKTLQEIRQATTTLVEQREAIGQAKIPLEKELTRLETRVKKLRLEAKKLQDIQDSKVISLDRLEQAVNDMKTDNEVIRAMLSDFEQKHKEHNQLTQSSITGRQTEAPHGAALPENKAQAQQQNIFERSLISIEQTIAGQVYQGEVIDKAGTVNSGDIVHIGANRWFLANDGRSAGVIFDVQEQLPSLYQPIDIAPASLQALINGDSVALELDVINGKALLANKAERSVMAHLSDGGVWVVPILIFSILAVMTALIKGISLHRLSRNDDGLLREVLHHYSQKQDQQAMEKLGQLNTPLSQLLRLGIANMHKAKAELEDIFYAELLATKPKIERYLGLLAVVASTAPLLGLLGTVTGLINTFELLSIFGTGNAETLSGGISEALITTELGLVVAIPALILHVVLSKKAQAIVSDMEKHAQFMLNAHAV